MRNFKTTIRVKDYTHQAAKGDVKIDKLIGTIGIIEFVKLLRYANNEVNPRIATINRITKSIHDTLTEDHETFVFKSKGLLVASENCELLERSRINLSFQNEGSEGIMDGGHNAFAIATYILQECFDLKLKKWQEVKNYWQENYELILETVRQNESEGWLSGLAIPCEFIFPSIHERERNEANAMKSYHVNLAEICFARNNNVQLTKSTQSNHKGHYDYLKETISPEYNELISWKSGEEGIVKDTDICAIACIPLIFLQQEGLLPEGTPTLNKMSVYSQKNHCVQWFEQVLEHDDISDYVQDKYVLKSKLVKSALDMTEDICEFFDEMFLNFPKAYNRAGGKFGLLTAVDTKAYKTPMRKIDRLGDYKYANGFILPIVTGITKLMEYDSLSGEIYWNQEPCSINIEELNLIQYKGTMELVNYDPQKIGKKEPFYAAGEDLFRNI